MAMKTRVMLPSERYLALACKFKGEGRLSDAARLYFKAGLEILEDGHHLDYAVSYFETAGILAREAADVQGAYKYLTQAISALSKCGRDMQIPNIDRLYYAAISYGEQLGKGDIMDPIRAEAMAESITLSDALREAIRVVDRVSNPARSDRMPSPKNKLLIDIDSISCEIFGDQTRVNGRLFDAAYFYRHGLEKIDPEDEISRIRLTNKIIYVLEQLGEMYSHGRNNGSSDKKYEEAFRYAENIGDKLAMSRIANKMLNAQWQGK